MEPHESPTMSLRPAPVLAGVGTFLLTAASVSFVSARWDRFGPGDRFLALLVFSAVVLGVTTALRRIAPATARSLDVLTAALVPVDVAALAIVSGASWPTVLLAAGPAAVASAEVLRRRDPSVVTEFGTIAGGVMAMCGVSAQYDVALAPLVAGLGLVGCLVVPWNRDRLAGPAWAILAGLAPALRVLDEAAFTGDGTMRRLGLLDVTPWEATLVAGIVAGAGLAVATLVRRSLTAGVGGVAVVVATTAAMWAEHEPPRSLLLVAAAVVVALVEIALTHRSLRRLPAIRTSLARANAVVNGALTFVVVATALAAVMPAGEEYGPEWVYVAAALAVAWVVVDVRRTSESGRTLAAGGGWAPATWGVVVTAVAGTGLAAGATTAGIAFLVAGVALLATQRVGRVAVGWTAGIVGPLLLVTDWRVTVGGAVVGAGLVSISALIAHRDHDAQIGGQAVAGLLVPVTLAGLAAAEHSPVLAGATVIAVLWVAATVVDVRMPSVALGLRGAGLVAVTAVVADDPMVVALVLLGSSVAWVAHHASTRQPGSAVLGVWSAGLGVAILIVDAATDPLVVFAAMTAGVGFTIIAWGADRDIGAARLTGGLVVWWASLLALVGAEVDSLEPYLYPVLLALGWAMHREAVDERADWSAIGVPIVLAAIIAFGQRVTGGDAGHTLLLGAIALGLCIVGAVRQHQAALVVGAAATVAVGAFEALDRVVGIESWSWLVVSGAAALTVAATLELTDVDPEPAENAG